MIISREVSLGEIRALTGKVFNLSALKSPFVLNRNLSVRAVVIVCMFVLFNAFSATLGTNVLAENILLMQFVALSMYMCDGVEYATATLSGNFKGQRATHKFLPLLQVALGTNLAIGLVVGLAAIFLPDNGVGQIVWSPLAQGILTGKYQPGQVPPENSRAANEKMNWYLLDEFFNDEVLTAVEKLKPIAQVLGLSMPQLALAWVLRSEYVSSAIIGASRPEQIVDNAAASGVQLSADVLTAIDQVLGSVIHN